MTKKYTFIIIILGIIIGLIGWQNLSVSKEKNLTEAKDEVADNTKDEVQPVESSPQNATYSIEGQDVTLVDGYSEIVAAPGSEVKIVTKYFGNELKTDLDGDGVEDVAFVLIQQAGGSGTFYYAVGAVQTKDGYVGTDGYLLGDRIAPQSTDVSQNPRHKNVVVFNYAERAPGEPMTTQPSVGKSVYLKLVPESMMWAIVEPDFEGESR